MRRAAQTRRIVDVDAPVVVVADPRVARVDAHPHAQVAAVGPLVSRQRGLRGRGGLDGGAGLAEDDQEGVAVGVHLDAAVPWPDRGRKTPRRMK